MNLDTVALLPQLWMLTKRWRSRRDDLAIRGCEVRELRVRVVLLVHRLRRAHPADGRRERAGRHDHDHALAAALDVRRLHVPLPEEPVLRAEDDASGRGVSRGVDQGTRTHICVRIWRTQAGCSVFRAAFCADTDLAAAG